MRDIKLYLTESGRSPVKDFLDLLPPKLRQKVAWVLDLIGDIDRVPIEFFKKLSGTEDIWEIRVHQGSNAIRLLCFFDGSDLIILTNGFLKKTDKIPIKEIELAEERKKEYLWRKSH